MNTYGTIRLTAFPEDHLDYRKGSGNTVEIYDIVVNSERGKGRGKELIQRLEQVCWKEGIESIYALVRCSNELGRSFYLSAGFLFAGSLNRFYTTEDAVVYLKKVGS